MLVQRGTLRVGDAVREARPGEPIEILGFDKPPPAGELCRVVENERQARHLANVRGERLRREQLAQQAKVGPRLEELFSQMQAGGVQDLNLVVKGDVDGSVEAAVSELRKIQHPEVRFNVIHTGVGAISENDVNLASVSNALVVGFNVRPSAEARALAEREGVDIRTYRVIYQLTQDIEQALVGMLRPVETEEALGEVEVRQIVRVGTVIHETSIAQLRRFKDHVREVSEGFECGILLEGFNDLREGDVFEVFETRQVERTDLSENPSAPAPA